MKKQLLCIFLSSSALPLFAGDTEYDSLNKVLLHTFTNQYTHIVNFINQLPQEMVNDQYLHQKTMHLRESLERANKSNTPRELNIGLQKALEIQNDLLMFSKTLLDASKIKNENRTQIKKMTAYEKIKE